MTICEKITKPLSSNPSTIKRKHTAIDPGSESDTWNASNTSHNKSKSPSSSHTLLQLSAALAKPDQRSTRRKTNNSARTTLAHEPDPTSEAACVTARQRASGIFTDIPTQSPSVVDQKDPEVEPENLEVENGTLTEEALSEVLRAIFANSHKDLQGYDIDDLVGGELNEMIGQCFDDMAGYNNNDTTLGLAEYSLEISYVHI
ncbi:hypothetical protein MMC30_001101 [Trapelia coarctata]|nr:hypothetical protein [Trapelia coarctata]